MVRKRLKPRQDEVGSRINVHSAPGGSVFSMHPKFSLENLTKSHCLSKCTRDEKAAFADKLHELSQLTWQVIGHSGRHGQGSETIARTAIKAPIPDCITGEVKLLAFRCIGMAPMVGYRDAETFYIVWIDRAFTLYAHH